MRQALACGIAAAAGAAVMALELLGSRWLAPAFGFTLGTWAVLIGVTLLGGAVGALLASRAGTATQRLLPALLLLASAATALDGMLAPLLVDALIPAPLLAGALAAATALILPPVTLLGAVLPLVAASCPATEPRARLVGRLVACSTAGSLVGTLVTGLVAIPELGLVVTASLWAFVLAALGLAATSRRAAAVATLAGVAALGALGWESVGSRATVLETGYGRLEWRSGATGSALLVDGIAQFSCSALDVGPGSLLRHRQWTELLPYLRPLGRSALVVGLGGGLYGACLERYGIAVQTIELDPEIVRIARERFAVTGVVHVGDGRAVLCRLRERFAFVVLDAFRGETPPGHLLTREAFAVVADRLEPGGIVCVHLIGRPGHAAVAAVAATLGSVFRETLCLRSGVADDLQDLFLLGSRTALVVPPHPDLAAAGWLGNESFEPRGGELLTDDRSAFETLYAPLGRELRLASRGT